MTLCTAAAFGRCSDYGFVTLLLTDGTPGLQIETTPGVWADVPHVPGAFVVNLGDMLHRWSNGLYRSTMHRVVINSERHRYSAPFFFEPNFDCVVTALPTCVSAGTPTLLLVCVASCCSYVSESVVSCRHVTYGVVLLVCRVRGGVAIAHGPCPLARACRAPRAVPAMHQRLTPPC